MDDISLHEREDFRQICREHDVLGTAMEALCGEFWARAVKMELERIAAMFDDSPNAEMFREDIAAAIRARSQEGQG